MLSNPLTDRRSGAAAGITQVKVAVCEVMQTGYWLFASTKEVIDMPNKDGTGPKGQGPRDGHGKGKGKGNNPGQGPMTGGKKGIKKTPKK